jgi:hypothetical protein
MMRAIRMTIAALGVVGATAVTAPAPASAQVFWPGFNVGFGGPVFRSFYRPAFWGGAYGYAGYRPMWRRYSGVCPTGWGNRYSGFFGRPLLRHTAFFRPWGVSRAYGFYGRPLVRHTAFFRPWGISRAYGFYGRPWHRHFGFYGHRFRRVGFFRHHGFGRFGRIGGFRNVGFNRSFGGGRFYGRAFATRGFGGRGLGGRGLGRIR